VCEQRLRDVGKKNREKKTERESLGENLGERERQTARETDSERKREPQRERNNKKERKREKTSEREKERDKKREKEREKEREKAGKKESLRDREIRERGRGRETTANPKWIWESRLLSYFCTNMVLKVGLGFVRNECANSVEFSLQGISSSFWLWKRNKLSVAAQT